MTPYTNSSERFLIRFEAKCQAANLNFTPPADRAKLGRYAFSEDVLIAIYVGIITGVLKDLIVHAIKGGLSLIADTANGDKEQDSVRSLCRSVFESTDAIDDGLTKLQEQGISIDEACVAIELLKEAIEEELREATVGTSSGKK